MRTRNLLKIITGLSIFSPAPILAHIDDAGPGLIGILLHPFTGIDHLLMLVVVGAGIVYYIRKYHRPNG